MTLAGIAALPTRRLLLWQDTFTYCHACSGVPWCNTGLRCRKRMLICDHWEGCKKYLIIFGVGTNMVVLFFHFPWALWKIESSSWGYHLQWPGPWVLYSSECRGCLKWFADRVLFLGQAKLEETRRDNGIAGQGSCSCTWVDWQWPRCPCLVPGKTGDCAWGCQG